MALERETLEREIRRLDVELAQVKADQEALRSRRLRVESKVSALREYMAAEFGEQQMVLGGATHTIVKPDSTAPGEVSSGLRAEIRKEMAGMGKVKPADVTAKLAARGLETAGATPFSTRVSGEMNRMMRVGILKRENGLYWLDEGKEAVAE